MDTFGDYFTQLHVLIPLVQLTLRACQQTLLDSFQAKLSSILKALNLQQGPSPPVHLQEEVERLLKPLLKQHYRAIFQEELLFT